MTTHTFKPDMPPPSSSIGVVAWMRANMFSSWLNTLLTLFAFYLIYLVVPPILSWAIFDANWSALPAPTAPRTAPAGCSFSSVLASSCTATTRPNCAGA